MSNLFIGGLADEAINEKYYKQVLSSINLGLSALFKRFPIKEGELKVQLMENIYTYVLKPEFAENNLRTVEDNLYIKDDEDNPFDGDIIKVERVYLDSGIELPLNDEKSEYSIFTPNMYTLKVPKDLVDKPQELDKDFKSEYLKVVYRATHPIIKYKDNLNPEKVEVDLPQTYLEALLYYVASRVHNPIGMQNDFHAGNSYAAKYEQECQRLEMQNIRVDQGMFTNDKLHQKGWV